MARCKLSGTRAVSWENMSVMRPAPGAWPVYIDFCPECRQLVRLFDRGREWHKFFYEEHDEKPEGEYATPYHPTKTADLQHDEMVEFSAGYARYLLECASKWEAHEREMRQKKLYDGILLYLHVALAATKWHKDWIDNIGYTIINQMKESEAGREPHFPTRT